MHEFSARLPGPSISPATRFGWLRIFDQWGIDTPPAHAVVPSEGLPEFVRYPAVLKPVDGAGSVDTFYLDGPADLPESALRMPQALLQPFVPGEPMSASFLVSPEGRAWPIGVGRQRMEIRDGRFRIPRRRDTGSLPGSRANKFGARWPRSKVSEDSWESISSGTSSAGRPRFSKSTRAPRRHWSGSAGSCRRAVWPRLGSRRFDRRSRDDELLGSLYGLVHSQGGGGIRCGW